MSLSQNYSKSLKSQFKSDAKGLEKLILNSSLTVLKITDGLDTIFYGKPLKTDNLVKNSSRPKNPLDLGIIPILDLVASVDYCDIINYGISRIPSGTGFDPNTRPSGSFDRLKWDFQYTAFNVQKNIDTYYSNYTEPNNPDSKNALFNLVNDIRSEFGTFTSEFKKAINNAGSTPSRPVAQYDIASLAQTSTTETSIQLLVQTFPVLNKIGGYVNDKLSSYEKYTDYRQISNPEFQKIIDSINKIREYCVLIQALNTPASVTSALGLIGLGNEINESVKKIQEIINPAQAIPTLKKILDACVKIQAICNNLLTIIRFGQLIINIAVILVKVFKVLITFFKVNPLPNMMTTAGITTTFSSITDKIEKDGVGNFVTRLNQVNILLGLLNVLLTTIIPILNDVISRLRSLISNLQACSSLNSNDPDGIVNKLVQTADRLQSTVDSFQKFIDNKKEKDSINLNNNQFGEYSIRIIEEEVTDETFTLRRRYGVALDNRGVKILQSTPTFASDDSLIIREVKQLLAAKNLVKTDTSSYSLDEEDTINQATSYLYDDTLNWQDINNPGYSLDSPNNNNDSEDNLGLNSFINGIKGSKRLRDRVRKMMEKNKNNLQSNLSSTDPSGRYSRGITNRA